MSAPSDVEASQNQMSSGVTPEHLKGALEQRLGAVHVDIIDMSGALLRQTTSAVPLH